ncbi:MAG: hypothetical protein ABI999_18860 [Acidobacteriota bacterium]
MNDCPTKIAKTVEHNPIPRRASTLSKKTAGQRDMRTPGRAKHSKYNYLQDTFLSRRPRDKRDTKKTPGQRDKGLNLLCAIICLSRDHVRTGTSPARLAYVWNSGTLGHGTKTACIKIAKTVEQTSKILVLLLILFCFSLMTPTSAQERPKALQIDEFGKICSEDMEARLDNLLNQLNANPSAKVVILFYGDRNAEGRNVKYIQYITKVYPRFRQIPSYFTDRVKIIRGENLPEMNFEVWLVPPGSDEPKPTGLFAQDDYKKPTLFDHSWADFNKNWSRKSDIYSDGFYDLGCGFSPNRGLFAKALKENKSLSGFLIVYTAFGKDSKRGRRIANYAVSDLANNFKIPSSRLRAIYGGNREEPEIEFWLVPRGDLEPKPTPRNSKN